MDKCADYSVSLKYVLNGVVCFAVFCLAMEVAYPAVGWCNVALGITWALQTTCYLCIALTAIAISAVASGDSRECYMHWLNVTAAKSDRPAITKWVARSIGAMYVALLWYTGAIFTGLLWLAAVPVVKFVVAYARDVQSTITDNL